MQKIESERNNLKAENEKLESKVSIKNCESRSYLQFSPRTLGNNSFNNSQLSELTADLAEEHSTSTLATERLDAEMSERLRLEKEFNELQQKNKTLQQTSERLEMELIYSKSDLNGLSEDEEDGEIDGGIYKQRYERATKELEFTKRRLQQQHEDDLEQLVGLKKQLEKKLSDSYDEIEEQKQFVNQWKRKVQKLNGEMNDLKLLLEEQYSRNNILEKKQRKFDSEIQLLNDEIKQEKLQRERLAREKEVVISEKFSLESGLLVTNLSLIVSILIKKKPFCRTLN